MIAARRGTRAALHQVGALLHQRVSVLVCVGVCVGVRVGTGGVCGAVELAGVCVCVCRVCVCVCLCVCVCVCVLPFKGALACRESEYRERERREPRPRGLSGDTKVEKTAILSQLSPLYLIPQTLSGVLFGK